MDKRKGRPFSESKKETRVYVRFDDEDLSVLDECKDKLKSTRSEVIRNGIYLVKKQIENEQKK